MFLEQSRRFENVLDVSLVVPEQFSQISKILKNLDFGVHVADLSRARDLPQGIESHQRMHFWIGLDLREAVKLVQNQTNSRILRNNHFQTKIPKIFWSMFALNFRCLRITLRAVKALRVIGARGKPSTIVYRAGDS